ncbi:MAG: 2-oxoacid:acceptor oxidoreductase subunit alpha [Acidobacteriota bacterium]
MSTTARPPEGAAPPTSLSRVTLRFAGDSGDGIQVTGSQFTSTSALAGNDIASLPDFPAEIRAPRGTLAGVSGFQLQFSAEDIFTPGDLLDALVAFNPAALKANLEDLKTGGVLIVNVDEFGDRDLTKAGYEANPLEDASLSGYRLFKVPITTLTRRALEELELPTKSVDLCRNFFALGMAYWLYERDPEPTRQWISTKFAKKPKVVEANHLALKAGIAYCDATEAFQERYVVAPAEVKPGKYRNVNGNAALAMGLVAAAERSGKKLFYGSYPITPASDILHELSACRHFGVTTFQAEDEIAAVAAAIGASFAGNLGVTGTSGPGMALKAEAMGLAVTAELPLVIVDIQRGGPSTGLPTKTEQADLLQALYGRNSESPVAILAPATPADCFHLAYEACRLSMQHVVPVVLLSDGYLANGAEPWLIPKVEELPDIDIQHPGPEAAEGGFHPYARDEKLARPWAIPGVAGLEHRIGGIEKANVTGHVNYDPNNHHEMCLLRQEKVDRMVDQVPATELYGDAEGELLVLGWGSTWGALRSAVMQAQDEGQKVSHAHVRSLSPLPADLGDLLGAFERVLIPEINLGQLSMLVRARFLIDAFGLNEVRGKPYTSTRVYQAICDTLEQPAPGRA